MNRVAYSWFDLVWIVVALVMLIPLLVHLAQIVAAYPWRLAFS